MQFHHFGYVSGEPRVDPAAGIGQDRPDDLPDEMDVLIVGTGPAGMIAAAQLGQFPGVATRIIERRDGRLVIGQADGIQARSVETFEAFGFSDRITAEAYRITETQFWKPDPANPERISRHNRTIDDPERISEFPHLIVNQARVLDYFAEYAANGPGRIHPDYGWEFQGLTRVDGTHPLEVTLGRTAGPDEGQTRTVRTKYLLGADGARSRVRDSIGGVMHGDKSNHAWGVMDVLCVTDFPDIRKKCVIQSHTGGNILLIPREGGFLFRMYVDLGDVPLDGSEAVRGTTIEQIIAQANEIVYPYTLDVRNVPWWSVYEVGHRVTDRFDDLAADGADTHPRVFIAGDACHTHSAKAGQGMNVSMQDGFNIGWKLGHVLEGRSPVSLLETYSAERHEVAHNLITFDKKWAKLMATRPEDLASPTAVEEFYVATWAFLAGFLTEYRPSLVTAEATHQHLATGFPIGKRFESVGVVRACDSNPVQLGHRARADGRWRIYIFADRAAPGAAGPVRELAAWFADAPDSPITATPSPSTGTRGTTCASSTSRKTPRSMSLMPPPCSSPAWVRSNSSTTSRSLRQTRPATSSTSAALTEMARWWSFGPTSTSRSSPLSPPPTSWARSSAKSTDKGSTEERDSHWYLGVLPETARPYVECGGLQR